MNKGLFFLKCVVIAIIGVAVLGWVTMSLWNWLIPELFHGPLINYWQALGLFILSKILFSSWGGKKHHHGYSEGSGPSHWKHRFYEKFSTMRPEDREAFKEKMKEKWCSWEERKRKQQERGSDPGTL